MQTSLKELKCGKWAEITQIGVKAELARRLRDFGFVPGTQVCCRYRDPSGRVTALELRGTVIAMRTRDLQQIRVRC